MSQHDYIINNATFPNVRSDLNLALGAVATNNAGDDAPSTTYANQWWFDSNGNTLYMRNKDNDAWVTILTIGATSDTVTSVEGASTLAGIDDQSSSNDDQITITDTAVIINEDSDDLDFRVESNGNANAIFVNGGTDSVTIGASGVVQTVAGVPLYSADSSIYIGQDVSGTDDTAQYNVAIGFTTLDAITTGDSNVAIGYNAMTANTTGGSNISIGKSALGTNTTGSNNIAIGLDALLNPDTESHNLGVGNGALGGAIAGGEFNVAIGNQALDALTSGDTNVAVGYQAGTDINSGEANTMIGTQAGQNLTSPAHNTLVGYIAGGALTTGATNTAIGSLALDGCDTESNNLAIGFAALGGPVAGGEFNVAVGNYSLDALTSGDNNVCVGYGTGTAITSGTNNTFIGRDTGFNTTTGSRNIAIGSGCIPASTTGEHQIVLGFEIDASANEFSFGKSGNKVTNNFATNASWARSSDERKKTNIADATLGLDFINELRTVTFNWKASQDFPKTLKDYNSDKNMMDTSTTLHGMLAQDVKAALDTAGVSTFGGWTEESDGSQCLSQEMFIYPLIKAIQELSAKVTALENE